MRIRNINPKFGDCIEFNSIEEMTSTLDACHNKNEPSWIPLDGLKEGRDYEIIEPSYVLQNIIEHSVGYCKANQQLRNAIEDAVLGYNGYIIVGGQVVGRVFITEDMSEHIYNPENIICIIAQIVGLNGAIMATIAYYNDRVQHYLDIVSSDTTCEKWARTIKLGNPIAKFLGL